MSKISDILSTEATTGSEIARFQLLMRNWRSSLLTQNIVKAPIVKQKAFVNGWLDDFENIFRNQSAKINVLSGYTGFLAANTDISAVSTIDAYTENYRSTLISLTDNDLVRARGLRNGLATRVSSHGVANIYSEFDAFSKEARALGLTGSERITGFLNTLGKDYSTIKTVSSTGKVMRWKPEAYARMYGTTRDSQLRDDIFQEQLIEMGSDIVQVSRHGTKTPICQLYEGKVYSLTGKTTSLPILPQRPPFHPGCKHVLLSRPTMTTKEAKKTNFFLNKDLAKDAKSWTPATKSSIKKQQKWNNTNRPSYAVSEATNAA